MQLKGPTLVGYLAEIKIYYSHEKKLDSRIINVFIGYP